MKFLQNKSELKYYILIFWVGFILFVPMLGNVHLFDWDEINFAEAAREMIFTGDYLTVRIDFEPFHEKPPLFIWFQVASMKIFGINEFASRLPNAIIGIFTLLLIFNIGSKFFDNKFGILWVLAYIGSFLPHFYFRSGIIDPLFNLFMFLGIYSIFRYYQISPFVLTIPDRKGKFIIFSGIFISLAVLTKGPVGWFIPALCWLVFWFLNRKTESFPIKEIVLFSLISAVPYLLWYGMAISSAGMSVFGDFIQYQFRLLTTGEAGHGGPFYYHFVVLLFGCFPASIILLIGILPNSADNPNQKLFKGFLIVLLLVVLIVFSIVKTKIVHYSSLAYFPITFLAAYSMYKIVYQELKWKTSTNWMIGIIGGIFSILLIVFPLILINIQTFLPMITDKFTHGLLSANVQWFGIEYFIGIIYLAAIITSIILFKRKFYLKGFLTLFAGGVLVVLLFLPLIAPKIEKYTQATPIEFYQKLKGQDCYVHVLGYKSYAHYFYSQKPYSASAKAKGISHDEYEGWLLNGEIDKPVFFVCKNKGSEKYLQNPKLKLLFSLNGYVFLKREI